MFWMSKGANPAGMDRSEKEPLRVAGAKLLSITSLVPSPLFQLAMVPSSVAKMKRLGPVVVPGTAKSEVPLKTAPVGVPMAPGGLPAGGGILTTRGDIEGKGCPFPSYTVLTPALLSAIQKGPVGL